METDVWTYAFDVKHHHGRPVSRWGDGERHPVVLLVHNSRLVERNPGRIRCRESDGPQRLAGSKRTDSDDAERRGTATGSQWSGWYLRARPGQRQVPGQYQSHGDQERRETDPERLGWEVGRIRSSALRRRFHTQLVSVQEHLQNMIPWKGKELLWDGSEQNHGLLGTA